jgi:hypothetical protein
MVNVVTIETKKEEVIMPRGDKTGPEGFGSMTGRRMGTCVGNEQTVSNFNPVFGRGLGRGFRGGQKTRGFAFRNNMTFRENSENSQKSNKYLVENEINDLKSRLEFLEKELEKLS